MTPKSVLVTGGRGFIGQHLVEALRRDGVVVRVLTRAIPCPEAGEVTGTLADSLALARACEGVDTVFHCAGHAHAFSASGADESRLHWDINYEGSRRLAEVAAELGVRRLVFLSSVKASGDGGGACIDEDCPLPPTTPYGQSKRAAEEALLDISATTGMGVTILRPALVYGAGGRGNMERMGGLVRRGLFPPLPETGNRRSLVHVNDLVEAMRLAADDVRAVGRIYIVAHHHAPSGRELYDGMRAVLGYPPQRWAVPRPLLELAAWLGDRGGALLGRRMPLDSEVIDRLLGSACYSPLRIERELGWKAKVRLGDGLIDMFGGINRRGRITES